MTTSNIFHILESRFVGTVVVAGVGHDDSGDDGAGVHIVAKLRITDSLTPLCAPDGPEYHLSEICAARPDVVMFVDAVDLGAPPGTMAIVECDQLSRPWGNAHQPILSTIMRFVSEQTGADTFLIAIQPQSTSPGTYLSRPVLNAAQLIADCINEIALRTARDKSVEAP